MKSRTPRYRRPAARCFWPAAPQAWCCSERQLGCHRPTTRGRAGGCEVMCVGWVLLLLRTGANMGCCGGGARGLTWGLTWRSCKATLFAIVCLISVGTPSHSQAEGCGRSHAVADAAATSGGPGDLHNPLKTAAETLAEPRSLGVTHRFLYSKSSEVYRRDMFDSMPSSSPRSSSRMMILHHSRL